MQTGYRAAVTDAALFGAALTAARPQAVAALLRYFRNLDVAEEAFQEACVRALKSWPARGAPRDPAAWLIFVGRNSALDELRRRNKHDALGDDDVISDGEDESAMAEQLDASAYQDDVLRLLFICCQPELPAAQQIAVALRIVSGLSVQEIASAFLVSEAAMAQRITRAKRVMTESAIAFETPGPAEREARLNTVAAMVYLLFNEGYSASGGAAHVRTPLCEEAIRLGRLLIRLFPNEGEVLGLTALMLLQHARAPARLDASSNIVLLDDQERSLWNQELIAEGLALVEKAQRQGAPGAYQIQAAIAAVHARAARPQDTDWAQIDRIYAVLEALQPSPVVTLNRAVAVSRVRGPAAALAMLEPLAQPLAGYFHYYGVKGALLKELGRVADAREAFTRAIALARTPAEATHIRMNMDRLNDDRL
jgi:RNA polymerase sigma-70 factor (ECF subfamily)